MNIAPKIRKIVIVEPEEVEEERQRESEDYLREKERIKRNEEKCTGLTGSNYGEYWVTRNW